jgi:hypothetical protein
MNVQTISKTGAKTEDRMIITAASENFAPSLLALLGSLNLNWPDHPSVRVYDIGLGDDTLRVLDDNAIEVVKVPAFCPHWRKHFTWKIWCWNDAPAREILWMDSGLVVLKPLDDVFYAIDNLGYFVVPTYHPLTLCIALTEVCIASTEKMHRHDQAIISLLLYKKLKSVLMSDGVVYCSCVPLSNSHESPGQKVWVHRRAILPEDQSYFASRISLPGSSYMPKDPKMGRQFRDLWKKIFGLPERYIRRLIKGQPIKDEPYDGIRNK